MRILQSAAVLASTVALMSVAACGSSTAHPAATPSGTRRPGDFAAYASCLRQHGVNIPTARPTGRPAGGMFNGASRQALAACRSLAPRRSGRGMQEMQAFRSCLTDHGVSMPTPSPGMRPPGARRSPGTERFGGLNTSDPKTAKALKICRPLLPTRSPRPSPS